MSNKIKEISGFVVLGQFVKSIPEAIPVTEFEYRGVIYDSREDAENAKWRFSITSDIANALGRVIICGNYKLSASKIMTLPEGKHLYETLKAYFEPEKDNDDKS